MMIETSLLSLDKAVDEGKKISADMKVILPNSESAEIYGFVAIEDNIFGERIDMPPLGECNVFSNRIIFNVGEHQSRRPIFLSVYKATEERYDLYMLYIFKFLDLYRGCDFKAYKSYMRDRKIIPSLSKLKEIKIEEEEAFYYPSEHDLYFESSSKLRASASGFAVITRRHSKLSDTVRYEIYDSRSVKIERNEKM